MWQLVAFLLLSLLLALPVIWAWRFVWVFTKPGMPTVPDEDLPPAGVVLSLRGADPSLRHCLHGLLNQDYPDYTLYIIVDSHDDPAWSVVHEALARNNSAVRVHVQVLKSRLPTCSLKMSALVQAFGLLEKTCSILALIDADVIPRRDWLRSLATPLLNRGVGASTGVRWFTPTVGGLGTLVRYLWNAAACTQMYAFGIPWGGSLAFRTDVVRDCGLAEVWSRCFCEDTSARRALGASGLKVQLVPAATAVSSETTDLTRAASFIRRQLVCVRLHHASWPAVCLVGWTSALALAALVLLVPTTAMLGAWEWTAALAGAGFTYLLGMLGALLQIEGELRRRTQKSPVSGFVLDWKYLLAVPVTQVVYSMALASAAVTRRIDWRGITYELPGRGSVRLLEYQPYRPRRSEGDARASVA